MSAGSVNLTEVPTNPQPVYPGTVTTFPLTVGIEVDGNSDYIMFWNFQQPDICAAAKITKLNVSLYSSDLTETTVASKLPRWISLVQDAGGNFLPLNATEGESVYGGIGVGRGSGAGTGSLPSLGSVAYSVDLPNVSLSQFTSDYSLGVYFHYYDYITFNKNSISIEYDDSDPSCPKNNPPVISTSTGSATSTTPSGTTVVTGTSLNASDPDNDTLTYSITAGNDGSYFTIDPDTGNITTTQTGIPAGTYTLTVQVDDGNGGTATAEVTITITDSPASTMYCPAPGDTTQVLTKEGDCDGDGISNQTEGYDPDGDGNQSTGTNSVDTDGDGTPDFRDKDSDSDGATDQEEGTVDKNNNGIPAYKDPSETNRKLANTGANLNLILALSTLAAVAGLSLKKFGRR